MDALIQECLDFLREEAKRTPSVLATREEVAYFPPPKIVEKKVALAPPPPIAPKPIAINKKIEAPAPVATPVKAAPVIEKKNFDEMRQTVSKMFPGIALRETVPDDLQAKKMARLWEEKYLDAQIVIIAFGETAAGMTFLNNVTKAINRLIAPAQLIDGALLEKEHGWELLFKSPTLKAALISPWASWKSTSLVNHFKQNGSTQQQFLGEKPVLILEPTTVYLQNPDRKRKLWQLINTQLLS